MKKVLVLDFGGQYNLLVARRVRECGVYCEIKSYRLSMADIRAFGPDALILTGGPATVFEPNAPMVDRALFEMGIPVLGICYGQQLHHQLLCGQCRKAETREYGKIQLTHTASPLFAGVPETSVCWMSHGVEVERIAPGFKVIATTAMEIINAMAKTYVPRNFLIMYQSSRFRNLPLGSFIFFHILQFIFLIILSIRVSPSSVSR